MIIWWKWDYKGDNISYLILSDFYKTIIYRKQLKRLLLSTHNIEKKEVPVPNKNKINSQSNATQQSSFWMNRKSPEKLDNKEFICHQKQKSEVSKRKG